MEYRLEKVRTFAHSETYNFTETRTSPHEALRHGATPSGTVEDDVGKPSGVCGNAPGISTVRNVLPVTPEGSCAARSCPSVDARGG